MELHVAIGFLVHTSYPETSSAQTAWRAYAVDPSLPSQTWVSQTTESRGSVVRQWTVAWSLFVLSYVPCAAPLPLPCALPASRTGPSRH